MLLEKYTTTWDAQKEIYEFVSQGPKGFIRKVIRYEHLGSNIYNLGFGDWDNDKGIIDDAIRTNNNDSGKVLATVASTVIDFLYKNSFAQIFIQGSTPARTRLYQMGIANNWNEIRRLVIMLGIS